MSATRTTPPPGPQWRLRLLSEGEQDVKTDKVTLMLANNFAGHGSQHLIGYVLLALLIKVG
jgi:hypothetical protein